MKKLERLIAIVMILLQREQMSASALAAWFQVSKRTILRDMETLGLANIPIYASNGVNGGYAIMDAYKLDKRLLSGQDIQNLLTALGGLEQIMASPEVMVTLQKIQAMASTASLPHVVHVYFYDWEGRADMRQLLAICQAAMMKRRLLGFGYADRHGQYSERRVEPAQLHFSETSWYLRGYCLQRQALRTFKLSRMEQLHMLAETFLPREQSQEQLHHNQDGQPLLIDIVVQISMRIKEHFIERYGRHNLTAAAQGQWTVPITMPAGEIGYRFLAGFGAELKVLHPPAYIRQYCKYVRSMLERYDEPEGV